MAKFFIISHLIILALSPKPNILTLCSISEREILLNSTNITFSAPLEIASIQIEPTPANKSIKTEQGILDLIMSKTDFFILPSIGRIDKSLIGKVFNTLPHAVPEITFKAT